MTHKKTILKYSLTLCKTKDYLYGSTSVVYVSTLFPSFLEFNGHMSVTPTFNDLDFL